jgi:hypothetical protein
MPLSFSYHDAYLAPLITADRETRAAAEVAQLGAFDDAWAQRLAVLRAYVLTCVESQKAPDDLFAAKLSAYRKEFDAALPQARAAVAASSPSAGGASALSVTIERC